MLLIKTYTNKDQGKVTHSLKVIHNGKVLNNYQDLNCDTLAILEKSHSNHTLVERVNVSKKVDLK